MWLYLGPSCPDRSFFRELSAAKINTWMHKVLDHGAYLNLGAGPAPLQEGVASARVSLFGPALAAYAILSFHLSHGLAQVLRGVRSKPWGCGEVGGKPCLQREDEGTKREKAGPERYPQGGERVDGIPPLNLSP
jgi:hypothetical protein